MHQRSVSVCEFGIIIIRNDLKKKRDCCWSYRKKEREKKTLPASIWKYFNSLAIVPTSDPADLVCLTDYYKMFHPVTELSLVWLYRGCLGFGKELGKMPPEMTPDRHTYSLNSL